MRIARLLVVATLAGCGPSVAPPAKPPDHSEPKPVVEPSPRVELLEALRKVESRGDVMGGLGPKLAHKLDRVLEKLSADERAALASDQGAAMRPLLHVAVGGGSRGALYRLATGAAAADAISGLGPSSDELVSSTRAVSERAAARWLRQAVLDLPDPDSGQAGPYTRVARAALTLGERGIAQQALQVAADSDPQPARWLALAEASAFALDVPSAKAALAKAADHPERYRVERLMQAATLVQERPAPGDPFELARAFVTLELPERALRALEGHHAAAEGDLGKAATLALAMVDASTCPGLPPGTGNALVCARAWQQHPRSKPATALLSKAWKSKAGRDRPSIEVYLGLVHVLPWMHAVADGQSHEHFDRTLKGLREAAHQAAEQDASFQGLALFADTFGMAVAAASEAKQGERLQIDESQREALAKRAHELAEGKNPGVLDLAGVLAVAAAGSQDRDIHPLLQALPEQLPPDYAVPRAVLLLWSAVTRDRSEEARQARAALQHALREGWVGGLDQARIVLLMAESEALLAEHERSGEVLERIAKKLLAPDVPEPLRLRAALDAAGAQVRAGRVAEAQSLLAGVVRPEMRSELSLLARGHLLVLPALSGTAADQKAASVALGKLWQDARVPASLALWRESWLRHLSGKPRLDAKQVAQRVGAESARLFQRGALPTGNLQLAFDYSVARGLRPLVVVEPRLVAVVLPPEK